MYSLRYSSLGLLKMSELMVGQRPGLHYRSWKRATEHVEECKDALASGMPLPALCIAVVHGASPREHG